MMLSALQHGMAPPTETQCPVEKTPNKQPGLGTKPWGRAVSQQWGLVPVKILGLWLGLGCRHVPARESRTIWGGNTGLLRRPPSSSPHVCPAVHDLLLSALLPKKLLFIAGLGIYRRARCGEGLWVPPST